MTELPDLYLLFTWRRDARPVLVHRDPAGTVRRLPLETTRPAPGALVVHGPGPAPLDEASAQFFEATRESDGAVLPVARVLRSLGIRRRASPKLLRDLGGSWEAVDDPEIFALEFLRRLGDVLRTGEDLVEGAGESEGAGSLRPLRELVRDAPEGPGVYAFLSRDDRALYVGKATSLRRRLESHLRATGGESTKRAALVRDATGVRWEPLGSELEALLREQITIRRERPALNTHRSTHLRRRGRWRSRAAALVLPSASAGHNELCLVSGEGSFHWERVPRRPRLPRGTWTRVRGFLGGTFSGWGPGQPGRVLEPEERRELAEITLSWLAVHEAGVTQVDLSGAGPTRDLAGRLGRALGVDPTGGRVEVR